MTYSIDIEFREHCVLYRVLKRDTVGAASVCDSGSAPSLAGAMKTAELVIESDMKAVKLG